MRTFPFCITNANDRLRSVTRVPIIAAMIFMASCTAFGGKPLFIATTQTVDIVNDEFDGNFSPGDLSLREAVFLTNNSSGDRIQFAAMLIGKTLKLNNELVIEGDVVVQGPGPDKLTIMANGTKRLMTVTEGFRRVPMVEIAGLKLMGANTSSPGAAIQCVGANLVVRECWLTGNSTSSEGGAVQATAGRQNPTVSTAMTIQDCTISGNSAASNGGGIAVSNGKLNVINTTLSDNAAGDQGGGIFVSSGTVSVTNCTVAANRADSNGTNDPGSDLGGGIAKLNGNVALKNSLVIGNRHGTNGALNDIHGTLGSSSRNNIIGHAGSAGGLVDAVQSNLVGINGAGSRPLPSVINPALTVSVGKTPTHNLAISSVAIDSGENSVAVDPAGSALVHDQRGISRFVDGDANGVATVDRGSVEFASAPVITVPGTLAYGEQAAAAVISPSATVSDLDSANFGGGLLTVSIGGVTSSDRLSVRNQGTAAGQIGVSGQNVRFGGTVIGIISGGSPPPLRIQLNSNATIAATRALLRNITFRNISDAPPTLPRQFAFVLTDNTGLRSAPAPISVTVIPQNDPPSIGNQGSNFVIHNLVGNNPTKILALGTVADADSPDFAGGVLKGNIIQSPGTDNRLSFASPFSKVGNTLRFNGTAIGTVNPNGGVGATQLIVTFNSAATRSIVETLVRSVTFQISHPTGDDEPNQTIRISVTDGDGGTSNVWEVTVDPRFVRG